MFLNPKPVNYQILAAREPTLAAVREFREIFRRFLASKAVAAGDIDDALLVMSEHFSNVARHAGAARQLELGVVSGIDCITVVLRDDGDDISEAFDLQGPLEVGADLLRTEGMGLALIRSLVPGCRYTRKDGQNGFNEFVFDLAIPVIRPRIVVIDDDEVQLCLVEIFLEEKFDVKCFSDPHQALAHIFREGTDLILSDIYMPALDGVLLRKRLAAIDETCRIPFIFLSGCTEQQVREQVNLLSIDDFLSKPVDRDSLLGTVSRVLTRARDVANSLNAMLDRRVTEALWQPLPSVYAGYQLSCAYRVAARGGGDVLIPRLDNQGLTLVLIDVMGHGDQAKFFAHALAGFFHGLFASFPDENDPAVHLLRLSNAAASHPLLSGTLLTCQIVHIEPSGRVRVASAGHPRPILWGEGGAHREVDVQGVLAGLSAKPRYESVEVQPARGESLMCYTDGLFEFSRQGRSADDASQILAAIGSHETACHDAGQVIAEFDRFAGNAPCDDATVLVIRRD